MASLRKVINVADARQATRRTLPRIVFDFVDGGADDEVTSRRNTAAFADISFRPRAAVSMPAPSLSTTVLGQPVSMPLLLAPCGQLRLLHPDGDIGTARAAARAGTVSILSTASGHSLEQVAEVEGPKWFQLYFLGGREGAERLVDRAKAAGYGALVVTVDTPVGGNRERDTRNGYTSGLKLDLRNAFRMGPRLATRPGWLYRFARDGLAFELANASALRADGSAMPASDARRLLFEHPPTWGDLAWIREQWGSAPLVVKGLLTPDDARRAVDHGADAVVVSNHGGRQLDGAPSTIDALPDVLRAVGRVAEVFVDGGVRRGADVVKAVAMGATAVLIGRAYAYGLGAGGEAGVTRVLDLLREEIERTLRLLGCSSVAELDQSYVSPRTWPHAADQPGNHTH